MSTPTSTPTSVPTPATNRNRPLAPGPGAARLPIDDTRIREIMELAPPSHLLREFPASERAANTTFEARQAIHRILHGADDRLLVVVGPCSIHDYDAAIDYATRLSALRRELAADLVVVMRVYFEKPRTTVGWKGLINDPHLDDSYRINEGLRLARRILVEVNELDLPAGTEYLDMITPQYFADMIAWGAIGARTTESQVHRELASGLSCPVGFKNGTNGDVKIAVDAIKAASAPHHFLSVTKGGHSAIVHTAGNEDCHIILRGGRTPNYSAESVEATCKELASAGLAARLMIDCSHANSHTNHERPSAVARALAAQIAAGDGRICGLMIESHLNAGRQDLVPGQPLKYGVSITDACIGWDATVNALAALAEAVRARRVKQADEA
jgi:3-deoxy-7-phosphoheptulonate synthase